MIPGEIITGDGDIELNVGRATCRVTVVNTGDRPIQVGSHYHFFETNTALQFERALAWGKRLNIAAGTAVRFEPGRRRGGGRGGGAGGRAGGGGRARGGGPGGGRPGAGAAGARAPGGAAPR